MQGTTTGTYTNDGYGGEDRRKELQGRTSLAPEVLRTSAVTGENVQESFERLCVAIQDGGPVQSDLLYIAQRQGNICDDL